MNSQVAQTFASPRLIRLPVVESMTGLRRSAIYAMIGRGEFPRQRQLTARASAWLESDVAEWIRSRPVATGPAPRSRIEQPAA